MVAKIRFIFFKQKKCLFFLTSSLYYFVIRAKSAIFALKVIRKTSDGKAVK